MALHGGNHGVADFVIGNDPLFLIRKNGIFALVARDYNLDALLKVGLGNKLSSGTNGTQRRLVYDIGKLRAGSAGGHSGYGGEVDIVLKLYFLCVNAENGFAPLEVGQLHRNAAVETTGAGERRVKGFGTVSCRKDDNAVVALKAVHFGKKLVQGLLPLVVAAVCAAGAALLTYGVDFVDKDYAGSLFLCLAEQLTHLGSAHAHEHFNEFGAGNGEERYVCFACNGFCKHGFARSGRPHKQNTLRHGSADFFVFARVVEVVDDFLEIFLGLVLAGNVVKAYAFC